MTKKNTKHDQIIEELEERVKGNYQLVLKNIEYTIPGSNQTAGELDLVGICQGQWDIYEVKTNDGYGTAVKQLERARNILGACGTIKTFYYSGKEKKIRLVV
tara:strand:- start:676 stop:981 length:306 start_codon:yes stop_codon:yes gene_type:complete